MTPEQLKASILQYAIQGKLVEQRPEEGTAEELYQQIQKEKQKLIKEGKIKKEKLLAEISEDEIPFEIPESWKWVRLGNVYSLTMGQSPDGKSVTKGNSGIEFHQGKVFFGEDYILKSDQVTSDPSKIAEAKSVLLCVRAPVGIVNITDRELCIGRGLCAIKPLAGMTEKYALYSIRCLKDTFIKQATGTTFVAITGEVVKNQPIPLPPLEEQHRIVAKIEELLPYVDRYAAAYEKLEQFNAKFPEDMKKSILQYAIQGKLVEQRPEEGTAEELYLQIQKEKQKLIKEGKIKKEKPLAEITEEEIPFEIPESWKWVRLGDCTSYAQTKEKISPTEIAAEMWSLDLEDIQKETGNILVKTLASERKIIGEKVKFHRGQILYSKLRPYLKKILVAPDEGICTPELVPFYTYLIDGQYVVNVLKSPHVDYIINMVTYGVKMPRVGTDTMLNLLIPLPPLEEQHRIVAKIEELLPYCDQLLK